MGAPGRRLRTLTVLELARILPLTVPGMLETGARASGCEECRRRPQRLVHLLIPPLRAYVRLAPWALGKRRLWSRVVGPYVSHHSHDFTARTVYGSRLEGNQRTVMHRCIYYFGLWEVPLSRWMHETLAPGDTCVDVGANIGYFTLLAASRVGATGSVVALEPSPAVFRRLRANLALNDASNVRAVCVAAGAQEGAVPFYRATWNDAESSTVALQGLEPDGTVRAAPLHRLLTDQELARTRLIKVDVEGGEVDVIAGLLPALERLRLDAELVVEVHPHLIAEQGKSVADLLAMLEPAGFLPYWLPVDFSPLAHLGPPARVRPMRLDEPKDELVHMLFSRRREHQL